MRIVSCSELGGIDLEGQRGTVRVIDFIKDEEIIFGLRITGTGAIIPRRVHRHPMKQAMYVIRGHGRVDNGREVREFEEGDFMYFDRNEEHYFESLSPDLVMLEVQFP